MNHSKLYTHLGIAGALLVPALAVAAVDLNVFNAGDLVSAEAMNENFTNTVEAIDALEARVEELENAGLQPPTQLATHTAPLSDLVVIYQMHTDGVMTARAEDSGFTSSMIQFDVGTSAAAVADCGGHSANCTAALGRAYEGSSGSVFVPAGHYVAVRIDELSNQALARVFWQPLRGPDPDGSEPTLVESSHP